jgi:small nuclear ribonucleoprotein (snRNP)-like protein
VKSATRNSVFGLPYSTRKIAMPTNTLIRILSLAVILAFANPVHSDDMKLSLSAKDSIRSILEKQLDKTVTITLANGKEYTGRLISVGDQLLHIDNLRGMEYFDAIVTLETVQSIVLRTKK